MAARLASENGRAKIGNTAAKSPDIVLIYEAARSVNVSIQSLFRILAQHKAALKCAKDGLNKSVDCRSTHRTLSRADGSFRVSLNRWNFLKTGFARESTMTRLPVAALRYAL